MEQSSENSNQQTSKTNSLPTNDIHITLWITRDGSQPNERNTIGTIDRKTLLRFSESAYKFFQKSPIRAEFSLNENVDMNAARTILDWMQAEADNEPPEPLMMQDTSMRPEAFAEMAYLHHASWAFQLNVNLRGPEVRTALVKYLDQGPLTVEEFAIFHEFLGSDWQLCREAMQALMRFKREGEARGRKGVPEWEKIVEYCGENGIALPMEK